MKASRPNSHPFVDVPISSVAEIWASSLTVRLRELAAQKIRARLERRLANFLGCEVGDLPRMKLGTLVHTLFLLLGDSEELGGFHTSMDAVLKILGCHSSTETEPQLKWNRLPPNY